MEMVYFDSLPMHGENRIPLGIRRLAPSALEVISPSVSFIQSFISDTVSVVYPPLEGHKPLLGERKPISPEEYNQKYKYIVDYTLMRSYLEPSGPHLGGMGNTGQVENKLQSVIGNKIDIVGSSWLDSANAVQ